jgi:predicted dehydrogenase
MAGKFSRRKLLKGAGVAVAGTLAAPYILHAQNAGRQKLRIAFVGVDGQAGAHTGLAKSESCPCFCDPDPNRWKKIKELAPDAKGYTDFREMWEKHEKEIDAVVVTTPDHFHYYASMVALKAGKHCYTEKPLTWSIPEARRLAEITKEKKLATQMGNMGHNSEQNCLTIEFIKAGAIGDVTEVHSWTGRPSWPQGNVRVGNNAMPNGFNWDVWQGPAAEKPYIDAVHPFKWRGWLDYGCGAVGDMGCHTWDAPFNALEPDYPTEVELLEVGNVGKDTYPGRTHFMWTFPAKGTRKAYKAHWYSGGARPPKPEGFQGDLQGAGSYYVGTKGVITCFGDYGGTPNIAGGGKDFQRPPKTVRRSNHKGDWLAACRGEKPFDFPLSNFMQGGALTEVLLLGALTERIGKTGVKMECDAEKREIKTKAYLDIMDREPRKGWKV